MTRQARSLRPRPWVLYLALAGVGSVLYFVLGIDTAVGGVTYSLVGVSSAAAVALGARLFRPQAAGGWYLLALGHLMFSAGDGLFVWYDVRGIEPFPSLADGLYLLGYPFMAAGLLVLVRARTPGRDVLSPSG
jgi:hypothetical protein